MINRAKCKLCQSIIESHLSDEIVYCKCGAIAVCDGPAMRIWPYLSPNIVRIDDLGNEILVKYQGPNQNEVDSDSPAEPPKDSADDEAVRQFEHLIELDEQFLKQGSNSNVSRFDLMQYMMHILKILKGR